MIRDRRSKKIVVVLHCLLNHNSRDIGAAKFRGMNTDVIDVLMKHDVGLIQMPCPEMTCIDLQRTRAAGISIRDALDTPEGRTCCGELALPIADAIDEYRRNGYEVIAILGGDVESPGCAVPPPSDSNNFDSKAYGYGFFTQALRDELFSRNIQIPFRGIRDSARKTFNQDIEWLDNFLSGSKGDAPKHRWFSRK
jgi:predicted secreted protein